MDERQHPIYHFWMKFADRGHCVDSTRMFEKHLDQEEAEQALQKFIKDNLDAEREGEDGKYTIRSLNLEVIGIG